MYYGKLQKLFDFDDNQPSVFDLDRQLTVT